MKLGQKAVLATICLLATVALLIYFKQPMFTPTPTTTTTTPQTGTTTTTSTTITTPGTTTTTAPGATTTATMTTTTATPTTTTTTTENGITNFIWRASVTLGEADYTGTTDLLMMLPYPYYPPENENDPFTVSYPEIDVLHNISWVVHFSDGRMICSEQFELTYGRPVGYCTWENSENSENSWVAHWLGFMIGGSFTYEKGWWAGTEYDFSIPLENGLKYEITHEFSVASNRAEELVADNYETWLTTDNKQMTWFETNAESYSPDAISKFIGTAACEVSLTNATENKVVWVYTTVAYLREWFAPSS